MDVSLFAPISKEKWIHAFDTFKEIKITVNDHHAYKILVVQGNFTKFYLIEFIQVYFL